MRLKKDWSIAYFLYYISQIGIWLTVINIAVLFFVNGSSYIGSDSNYLIHDIPVTLTMGGSESPGAFEQDNFSVDIYPNLETTAVIQGNFNDHLSSFFFYNSLRLYQAILIIVVLYFFGKVLKNVAEGNPFERSSSTYFYIIGWTLLGASILNIMIQFIPLPLLNELTLPSGYTFSSIQPHYDYLLIGLFVLVLGYVFKEGTRFYEELKLTI
ncbi:DUF2975 domain-containing protein [Gracilimonas mengyeensis]|uniref:DUF2975 domain-containing protein n=1 Tax=Gracilimonas mengyeensis TaxID=1302730 RepID=A0A521DC28_9BACT|nr:DUF2975 domain-containing protein [Gracilimonas mengyeensis]SMO69344.1 Protein of unknown function [Gracilimonas mengyeensis]